MICSFCYLPFTKREQKEVQCFHCKKSICFACLKTYILGNLFLVRCFHCNILWDRQFLVNNVPKKFCDIDYRQHRIKVLHFRYEYYLPYISRIMDIEQKKKSTKDKILFEKNEIRKINFQIQNHPEKEERKRLRNVKEEKKHKLIDLKREKVDLYLNWQTKVTTFMNFWSYPEFLINRPCKTENCFGFLDEGGQCHICNKITCLSCHKDKTGKENHICKEEDKLVLNESQEIRKYCPSCRHVYFKIIGTNQKNCWNCNTSITWKDNNIQKGYIRNPNFSYKWTLSDDKKKEKSRIPSIYTLRQFNNDKNLMDYYLKISYLQEVLLKKILWKNEKSWYSVRYATPEQIYRKKLFSILKKYIQDGNKKSLEQFDYHYSCDLKMFYLLNSYIQEQTDNFLSLLRNKNIQECTELYQSIKENYKNRMIIFEKDCNKNYKYIYEKL